MRIDVLAKIEEVQESMNKKAEKLWDFDHKIIEQYNTFSAKEILKNSISDASMELEELSRRIRETVAGVHSNE